MQHGDFDPQQQKWFCSYWMDNEEWLDIHDYAPPTLLQEGESGGEKDSNGDDEE